MNVALTTRRASVDFGVDSKHALLRRKQDPAKSILALSDINLELKEGDRVGILGPNGAGKTTLLRLLSGILPPTSGRVIINGRVTTIIRLSAGILPKATCRENAHLRGLLLGHKGIQLKEFVNRTEHLSELGQFMDLPYYTLSSGMQSRFVVSLFNAKHSEILIMDEWVGVADDSQLDAGGSVAKAVDESRIFVLASHQLRVVRQYCNRGIVLNQGRLVFFGDTREAIKKHKSLLRQQAGGDSTGKPTC